MGIRTAVLRAGDRQHRALVHVGVHRRLVPAPVRRGGAGERRVVTGPGRPRLLRPGPGAARAREWSRHVEVLRRVTDTVLVPPRSACKNRRCSELSLPRLSSLLYVTPDDFPRGRPALPLRGSSGGWLAWDPCPPSARPRGARPPRSGRCCGTTPSCTPPTVASPGWPATSTGRSLGDFLGARGFLRDVEPLDPSDTLGAG